MDNYLSKDMSSFWMRIMNRLNQSGDDVMAIPEILKELCDFFQFGCSFLYYADHKKAFTLYQSYQVYDNHDHLKPHFYLEEILGPELAAQLAEEKMVSFTADTAVNPLEIQLMEVFRARSMILVPVRRKKQIQALIGLADRRGKRRNHDHDTKFAYSILIALANHVKVGLYQQSIDRTQKTLQSIMNNTGVGVYVNDYNTHEILYVNESLAQAYGGAGNMVGKKCWEVIFGPRSEPCEFCPKKELVDHENKPVKLYYWDAKRAQDDAWLRVLSAAFYWTDGRLAHIVSMVDNTENKKNEEIIRFLAEYDKLTGLLSRRRLTADCDKGLAQLEQEGRTGYVMFFDLDHFKQINDYFGHRIGDELLMKIGSFFQNEERTRGRCYRYGGDEFVILLFDETLAEVKALADDLMTHFSRPWKLEALEVSCRASIGITRYPDDAATTSDLLHYADTAMYTEKAERRGKVRFSWEEESSS